MPFGSKEIEEGLSYLGSGHINCTVTSIFGIIAGQQM
jgi:hypothetical protein